MSLAAISNEDERVTKALDAVARLLLMEAFELEELDEMRQVAEDACEEAGWKPNEIDKERTRQLMGFALRLEVEKKTKDLRIIKAAFGNALAAAKVAGIDDPKGPVRSAFQHTEMICGASIFPFEHEHKCCKCKEQFVCEWTCSKTNTRHIPPFHGARVEEVGPNDLELGFDAYCNSCEDKEEE